MTTFVQYFADAGLTVLGGALAAAAGLYINYYQNKISRKESLRRISIAVHDDLERAIPLYEKITAEYKGFVAIYLDSINEFYISRELYENLKGNLFLFTDKKLREEIHNYYAESSITMKHLEFSDEKINNIFKEGTQEIWTAKEKEKNEIVKKSLTDMALQKSKKATDEALELRLEWAKKLLEHKHSAQNLLSKIKPYV